MNIGKCGGTKPLSVNTDYEMVHQSFNNKTKYFLMFPKEIDQVVDLASAVYMNLNYNGKKIPTIIIMKMEVDNVLGFTGSTYKDLNLILIGISNKAHQYIKLSNSKRQMSGALEILSEILWHEWFHMIGNSKRKQFPDADDTQQMAYDYYDNRFKGDLVKEYGENDPDE